ncbi:MAG: NOB1 family endonuclease [Candidatus Bathyarchaeia archaeon]
MERAILLDTSAFVMGYEVSDVDADHYTVPSVRDELPDGRLTRLRFDAALRRGTLKVLTPDPRYAAKVEEIASELGEAGALSRADKELLALGLQLEAEGKTSIIVSDDYSIQNVADRLGLGYTGLATPGIRRRFEWTIYCPGCRRTFTENQPGQVCPVCGTLLKRRPSRKGPARGGAGAVRGRVGG